MERSPQRQTDLSIHRSKAEGGILLNHLKVLPIADERYRSPTPDNCYDTLDNPHSFGHHKFII
ncbi:hypothetical protein [Chamaesiphon sp.]|uniref:hypothetical protein n=1 Tax=Chamaesiphon sp. TaxID=2814140 RepID=UPI0035936A91